MDGQGETVPLADADQGALEVSKIKKMMKALWANR